MKNSYSNVAFLRLKRDQKKKRRDFTKENMFGSFLFLSSQKKKKGTKRKQSEKTKKNKKNEKILFAPIPFFLC